MNRGMPVLQALNKLANGIPEALVALVARLAIASVFWRSVQTKIEGWELLGQALQFFHLTPGTMLLFQYEYRLPLLSPTVAAHAATTAEFFFPLMLVLGLGTRLAALGLLGVTAVIQLFVFPAAWPVHILWFALLLYLLRQGGGSIALDALLARRRARPDDKNPDA